jgi:hypothetical protein
METLKKDIESVNTCSSNLPNRPVFEGREGGLRRRKYEPARLVLTPRIVTRFRSKVQRGQPHECWPWTAGRIGYGYGQFNAGRDARGRQDTRYAHRVAFQIATGIDPVGAVVMHTCDNPVCCNPAHLRLGTQTENIADASRKGRYLRGMTVGSVRWVREQRRTGAWPKRGRKTAA